MDFFRVLLDEVRVMHEAVRGFEKVLGQEQADHYVPALIAMRPLANLYAREGSEPEARALYVSCEAGLKGVLGRSA